LLFEYRFDGASKAPGLLVFSINSSVFTDQATLKYHCPMKTNCGSQPAGDSGLSANIKVECKTAIASRLAGWLPQWIFGGAVVSINSSAFTGQATLKYHCPMKTNCGSQPAGESGLSANINVECKTAIASRLAPTMGFGGAVVSINSSVFTDRTTPKYHCPMKTNCGSQPAGDSGLSANINIECKKAIASRLAPTMGFRWCLGFLRHPSPPADKRFRCNDL
jgi:hypothetical protein